MRTYDAALGCFVREISICHDTGVGLLSTFGDSNPDMSACIDRFEELDPEIEGIQVINWLGNEAVPDGCFRRVDGEWRSFVYRRERCQTR